MSYKLKLSSVKEGGQNMKKTLLTLLLIGTLYACLGLCVNAEGNSTAYAVPAADASVMTINEVELVDEAVDSATNGWVQDAGYWYYYIDGEYVTQELLEINGVYYYFDGAGKMQTGVFSIWDNETQENYWMLALPGGEVLTTQTGWYQVEEDWYYFKSAGFLAYDEIMIIDGNAYCFDGNGRMAVNCSYGFWNEDTDTYDYVYATESGALACGWYETHWGEICYYDPKTYCMYQDVLFTDPADGNTYYLDENGYLLESGIVIIDGVVYAADKKGVITEKGAATDGWIFADDNWYYCKDGELLKEQFLDYNGARYYFAYNGVMKSDTQFWVYTEDGEYCYYAYKDGKLASEWYVDEVGDKRYFDPVEYYMYIDVLFTDPVDGNMYYIRDNGWLLVSSRFAYGDAVYTADENGVVTEEDIIGEGWIHLEDDWYYFKDGAFLKDQFLELGDFTYYFDDRGIMQTDIFNVWNEDLGEWTMMLALPSGQVVTDHIGWYQYANAWYYFKSVGVIACSEVEVIDGTTYYFDWDGTMYTEGAFDYFDEEEGKWSYGYALESGVVVTDHVGWYQVRNNWYYFADYGRLVVNRLYEVDGAIYFFGWDGKMSVGHFYYDGNYYVASSSGWLYKDTWVQWANQWYYASGDFTLYTSGIYTINGNDYVLNGIGAMYTGPAYLGGKCYFTTEDGILVTTPGWQKANLYWYYVDETGKCYTDKWLGEYYLDESGRMAVGTVWIDDVYYYFDSNGRYVWASEDSFTGWELKDGQWYYHDSYGNPYTGWVEDTYYIEDGRMYYEEYVDIDDSNKLYYIRYDGTVVKDGWYNIPSGWDYDIWIYANADGSLVTDEWKQISGAWYFFDSWGEMVTGYCEIEGKVYLFDTNGCWITPTNGIYTGWQKIGDSWYYFYEDGTMLQDKDSAVINGVTYYFWDSGSLIADYVGYTDNAVYYYDENGIREQLPPGWNYCFDAWYYIESDGTPASGLKYINGAYYYFGYDGYMCSGSILVEEWGGYYFFDDSGRYQPVSTGWYYANESWYYYVNGTPITYGVHYIDGNYYSFYQNGCMTTQDMTGGKFVFSESGLVKNAWYFDGNYWFYADETGRYVSGVQIIDGVTYYFNRAGVWMK